MRVYDDSDNVNVHDEDVVDEDDEKEDSVDDEDDNDMFGSWLVLVDEWVGYLGAT